MIQARWHDIRWPFLAVAVCMLPLLASVAAGQSPLPGLQDAWRWRWFGVESGLPPAAIDRIIETSAGELWVQTRVGMAWYNGSYWQSPPPDPRLTDLQNISAAADSAQVYLISGSDLFRVDHAGYYHIPLKIGSASLRVHRVVPLEGRGLLLQGDAGLYLLHNGIVSPYPSPFDDPALRHTPEMTYGIYASQTGKPLLNAPGGVYRWRADRWVLLVPNEGAYLTFVNLCEDQHGNGTLCSRIGKDLFQLDWTSDGTVTRTPLLPCQVTLTGDCAPDGTALVLEQSGEAVVRRERTWYSLGQPPSELVGATAIHFDAHGDLWVGKTNGIHVCHLSSDIWTRLVLPDNPALNTVNVLMFAADSTLWVGTADGILVYRNNVCIKMIPTIGTRRLGIITTIVQDPSGNIWIGSGSAFGGTFRWNGVNWKHFGAAEGFSDNGVHRIVRDRGGRLWFLTISFYAPGLYPELEDGAFIYDGKGFERMDRRNGLPDGRVYAVAEDSAGTRWFATSKGIGRLRDDRWTYWTTERGLRSNKVFALVLDRSGRLWFGHQNQGLAYLDSTDTPVYMTAEQGFLAAGVWDFLIDYAGRLWVASREGLSVQDHEVWATLGLREGLPSPFTWPLLLRDSVLYIGMSNAGIAALQLSRLEGPAPVVRFNEPVDWGDLLTIAWEAYGMRGIPFAREIPTRYKLDGGAWSRWGVSYPLELRNMPSGEHTVTVQTRGPLAQVDPAGATLHFTVPPPFYRRPAFLAPVGVLTGLLFVLGVTQTRRKAQHSRELRERDARLRAVLDQQTELIVRILPNSTLSFVNGAVSRALRSEAAHLIGLPFTAVFPPSGSASAANVTALWSVRPEEGSVERDAAYAGPEGKERWVRWESRAIADPTGAVHEYQMLGRDITDTKVAEHGLEKSEERYRIIAETTGQLVYDLDLPTGRISWQGAILAVTGYTPEEFRSCDRQRLGEMIHPDDRARVRADMDTGQAAHAPVEIEFRLRKKNGEYIDIYDNGVFLASSGSDPERKLGTMTDVSARKQVEGQIATSLKEKEVLLKEIHHRVKNNLQVISSLLSLQSGAMTDPQAQEKLRESQNRIRSMALVHERLYQSENLARINFNEYLRSLGAFLFRSYNVPGVRLRYTIEPCHVPVNIAIPCGLVINELVSNALKYAFKGRTGGEVEIGFTLLPDKRGVLTVRDDGIGFPRELDFRHTHSLGLQLVNTLTSQINGTIGMICDRGTTFTITMPLEDDNETV